jgi:hypothetical protein
MNDPLIMVQASCVEQAMKHDLNAPVWIDSLVDVWNLVWVDSDEESARSAEDVLGIDVHEIVDGDFATVVDNPIVWFTDKFDVEDHEWCEDRNQYVPTLFVEVDPQTGITRKDVGLATAFIGYLGLDDD